MTILEDSTGKLLLSHPDGHFPFFPLRKNLSVVIMAAAAKWHCPKQHL